MRDPCSLKACFFMKEYVHICIHVYIYIYVYICVCIHMRQLRGIGLPEPSGPYAVHQSFQPAEPEVVGTSTTLGLRSGTISRVVSVSLAKAVGGCIYRGWLDNMVPILGCVKPYCCQIHPKRCALERDNRIVDLFKSLKPSLKLRDFWERRFMQASSKPIHLETRVPTCSSTPLPP